MNETRAKSDIRHVIKISILTPEFTFVIGHRHKVAITTNTYYETILALTVIQLG
jgi:hypothetical protein